METLKHSNLSENLYLITIGVLSSLLKEIRVFKSSIFLPNLACFASVSVVHTRRNSSLCITASGFVICEKRFIHWRRVDHSMSVLVIFSIKANKLIVIVLYFMLVLLGVQFCT